ncbi:MAG: hypothetical protein GY716_05935 [bacterium]|nr:hypothetical protein [bacterium]
MHDSFKIAALAVSALLVAGCSQQNDGGILTDSSDGLAGTWDYLVTNAYEAVFTGCTGDAAVLEGKTFVEGMSAAPICIVSTRFDVQQSGDDGMTVVPHAVSCSDGSTADVSGQGVVAAGTVDGSWSSSSDGGVMSTQSFSATRLGDTLEIEETARSFAGSFSGSCSLSPALSATAHIL